MHPPLLQALKHHTPCAPLKSAPPTLYAYNLWLTHPPHTTTHIENIKGNDREDGYPCRALKRLCVLLMI